MNLSNEMSAQGGSASGGKKTKILLALFFLLGGFCVFQKVQAIEYEMLGGKPAYPDQKVKNSESWFIYNLAPNEAKEDAVEVINLFADSWEALVYAGDTTRSSSGGFALKQFSEPKLEVGSWVRFYPSDPPEIFQKVFKENESKILTLCSMSQADLELKIGKKILTQEALDNLKKWCVGEDSVKRLLKSKEKIIIPFVIRIPAGTEVGEHTGGILIQKVAPEVQSTGEGSSIKLTTRVGVRIYETVPGEIIRQLSLADFQVVKNFKEFSLADLFGKIKKPQEYIIITTAKNEGNVSMEQSETIHIKNLIFSSKSVDIPRNFQVLKKDAFISNYVWNNPRFGYFSFATEIKYQNAQGEDVIVNSKVIKVLVMPWREMTMALIIFALGFLVYGLWKWRMKKKYGGIGWVEYKVAKNDTVNSLAQEYLVDWKILAKTNKLKAPYALGMGKIILVPNVNGEKQKIEEKTEEEPMTEIVEVVKEEEIIDLKKKSEKVPKKPGRKKSADIVKLMKKKTQREMVKSENIFSGKIIWLFGVMAILLLILLASIIFLLVNNQKKDRQLNEIMVALKNDAIVAQEEKKKEEIPVAEAPLPEILAKEVVVKILNEGAPAGMAGKIKKVLVSQGFDLAQAGNGENKANPVSSINFSEAKFKVLAEKIKEVLTTQKITATLKEAQTVEEKSADIVIILGE